MFQSIILLGMEDLRNIIGKNLSELRKRHGLTQLELAEKFNYTDKAISKWENGDTLPDVEVLYNLCEFYGVTIDYLTHEDNARFLKNQVPLKLWNKIAMTALLSSVIWMIATTLFVFGIIRYHYTMWQTFIWAVPLNCLFVVVINQIYFRKRLITFITWSIFVWTCIAGTYLSILDFSLWPIFLIGAPVQAALLIWLNLRQTEKNKRD